MWADKTPQKGRRGGSISASGDAQELFQSPTKVIQPTEAPNYGPDAEGTKRALFASPRDAYHPSSSTMVSEFTADGISARREPKQDVPFLTRSKSELPPSLLAATAEIKQAENSTLSSIFKASSPNSGHPSPRFGGSQDKSSSPWGKSSTGVFSTAKPTTASSIFSSSAPASGSPYKSAIGSSLFSKSPAGGSSSPQKTSLFGSKIGSGLGTSSSSSMGNPYKTSSQQLHTPYVSSVLPSHKPDALVPLSEIEIVASGAKIVPPDMPRRFYVSDHQAAAVEDKLRILTQGLENATNLQSSQTAFRGFLYNRLPENIDSDTRNLLQNVCPASSPSLTHEGYFYPVDSQKWNQSSKKNPDPSTLYPAQVVGVAELELRQKHQAQSLSETRARLDKLAQTYAQHKTNSNKYDQQLTRLIKRTNGARRAVLALRGLVQSKLLQGLRPYSEVKGNKVWAQGGKAAETSDRAVSDLQSLGKMKKQERKDIYEEVQIKMVEMLSEGAPKGRHNAREMGEQARELELMLREIQSANEEHKRIAEESSRVLSLGKRLVELEKQ